MPESIEHDVAELRDTITRAVSFYYARWFAQSREEWAKAQQMCEDMHDECDLRDAQQRERAATEGAPM